MKESVKKIYIVDEIIKKAEKSTKDWREGATGGHKYWIEEDYDKAGRDKLNKKNIFHDLQPLYMDEEIYEKYLEYAEDIETKTLENLEKMEVFEELEPLVKAILREKKAIEQESFLIK